MHGSLGGWFAARATRRLGFGAPRRGPAGLSRSRALSLVLVAIVAADWTTKFFVQNHLRLGGFHPVVDGWVWLAHRRNPGVAFSWFATHDLEGWRLPILAAASMFGIAVAAVIFRQMQDAAGRAAAGLVMAGAVGNLGDRLMNGAVTDFILIRFFPFVFNVADVAITAGAILLAARLFLEERSGSATSSSA